MCGSGFNKPSYNSTIAVTSVEPPNSGVTKVISLGVTLVLASLIQNGSQDSSGRNLSDPTVEVNSRRFLLLV